MASRYLDAQIATLDAHGFSKQNSLSVLGIQEKDLSDKYNRFDLSRLTPLYEAAAKALNDPHIDLRVGFEFRVSTFEQTGNIYTVCENIRQVVEMNRHYQPMAIYAGDVSLVEGTGVISTLSLFMMKQNKALSLQILFLDPMGQLLDG